MRFTFAAPLVTLPICTRRSVSSRLSAKTRVLAVASALPRIAPKPRRNGARRGQMVLSEDLENLAERNALVPDRQVLHDGSDLRRSILGGKPFEEVVPALVADRTALKETPEALVTHPDRARDSLKAAALDLSPCSFAKPVEGGKCPRR
jgi:hypothetical protein